MLKTITFINANPDWRERLSAEPYNLVIKEDGGFVMLNYSQRDSDFEDEIVRECRGVILDASLTPVCVPFFKFGNYGESYAAKIDWATAKVEEKIDGSLIKLWHYNGKWNTATDGTIFATSPVMKATGAVSEQFSTFADLFRAGAGRAGLDYNRLDTGCTYMFELVSPYNRVIVPYEDIDIYHIGTRDNSTLKEFECDIGVKKPAVYDCGNITDLIEMASRLRYCEEGYVVKDGTYNRIKVKGPAYVACHYLLQGVNDRKLLDLIRKNESAEFLTYFPEYKQNIDALAERFENLVNYLNAFVRDNVETARFETRKDFAAFASKTLFPAFLFGWYDGRAADPREWLWGMQNEKIIEHIARYEKAAGARVGS
jgi:hypothetical protein